MSLKKRQRKGVAVESNDSGGGGVAPFPPRSPPFPPPPPPRLGGRARSWTPGFAPLCGLAARPSALPAPPPFSGGGRPRPLPRPPPSSGAVPGRARGLGHMAPTYNSRFPGSCSDGHRGSALIFYEMPDATETQTRKAELRSVALTLRDACVPPTSAPGGGRDHCGRPRCRSRLRPA